MTDISEIDHTALLAQVANPDALAQWSETRRNDFCKVFGDRAKVTRYLLIRTAWTVAIGAQEKHFISEKHHRSIAEGFGHTAGPNGLETLFEIMTPFDKRDEVAQWNAPHTIGGRSEEALNLIASKRAEQILSQLPSLSKAVRILSVETANQIDRKDKLLAEGETLRKQLDEICGVIDMADLDQSMTIGAFRAMVAEKDKTRKRLLGRLHEITQEGRELEERINKALFAGLPGLSDAVVQVIRNHLEQAVAMDATTRRVEEFVKFGDSAAAVELLHRFERDEAEVSDKVKDQFAAALEMLKLAKNNKLQAGSKSRKRSKAN